MELRKKVLRMMSIPPPLPHIPPLQPMNLYTPPHPVSLFYEESYLVLEVEHALDPLRMYDP